MTLLKVLAAKWTVPILQQLAKSENVHYITLYTNLYPISTRALSLNLKKIRPYGLVTEKFIDGRKIFFITDKGKRMLKIAESIEEI